jgi:aerobic-type carbon monoxide dehydrogenase small subunit (CoxS/CutS family)
MITALSILAMVVLFVVFGLLHQGEGKGCDSGNCGSCSNHCDVEAHGRLP